MSRLLLHSYISMMFMEAYENHQGDTIKVSSDPLYIHRGPITRAWAKKTQAVLNGLIEKML